MREVVIVSAVRTAIGRFNGALASMSAVELGTTAVRDALRRAAIAPPDVSEVIMGQVLQAGAGPSPARQVLLKAGIPCSVPAYTVNKVCGSGLKAVTLGALAVAAGESEIVVAGGMESMSCAPYLLPKARWGYRLGDDQLLDSILRDALVDPSENYHMAQTAENLAAEFKISRRQQDEFAAMSQQRAAAAMQGGNLAAEIVGIPVPQRKGPPQMFVADEGPRPETTLELLTALKPAFRSDGTVTAGNASTLNDGAAALVMMSAAEAQRRGLRPLARVLSWASAGVEPARMGCGPVPATQAALAKAGITLAALDAVEVNEAFAAQVLAVIQQLGLDHDKVNLNGGAIALGHPVGASGARILVTLLHVLAARQLRYGLATLCVGGGQGIAVVVERCA